MTQWLRLCTSNAGGIGSVPGQSQGTKRPRAACPKKKKKCGSPGGAATEPVAPEPPAPVAGDPGLCVEVGGHEGPARGRGLRRNSSARRKGRPAMTPSPNPCRAGVDECAELYRNESPSLGQRPWTVTRTVSPPCFLDPATKCLQRPWQPSNPGPPYPQAL